MSNFESKINDQRNNESAGIPPTVCEKRGKKRIYLFEKKRISHKKEEKRSIFFEVVINQQSFVQTQDIRTNKVQSWRNILQQVEKYQSIGLSF